MEWVSYKYADTKTGCLSSKGGGETLSAVSSYISIKLAHAVPVNGSTLNIVSFRQQCMEVNFDHTIGHQVVRHGDLNGVAPVGLYSGPYNVTLRKGVLAKFPKQAFTRANGIHTIDKHHFLLGHSIRPNPVVHFREDQGVLL